MRRPYQKPKLQPIYQRLFEEAIKQGYKITDKLIAEKFPDIANIIEDAFSCVPEASKKFDVFSSLHLIEEMLQTEKPAAFGVRVDFVTEEEVVFAKVYIPHHGLECTFAVEQQVLMRSGNIEFRIKVVNVETDEKNDLMLTGYFFKDIKEWDPKCANKEFEILILPNEHMHKSITDAIEAINTVDSVFANKLFITGSLNDAEAKKYIKSMSTWVRQAKNLNNLNAKQKEAVFGITRSVSTTFILFGPPGTGKTTTLVESVCQLVKMPEFQHQHFLICAPSNMAADAFTEALLKRGEIPASDIYRFMRDGRDASDRNPILKDVTRSRKLPGGPFYAYMVPKATEVRKFRIIISTLGSSPNLKQYLLNDHFSHVFIDEAGLSSEMESWLPLGHVASEKTRLILAGDPKLLGPVCTVRVLSRSSFKMSLLGRLLETTEIKTDPRYLIQLTDNYRSHPKIVEFASKQCYENTLVPMIPATPSKLPFLLNPQFPLLFHNVNGRQFWEKTTCGNKAEAKAVGKYVSTILRRKYQYKPEDIGIIAPYRFQKKLIEKRVPWKCDVESVERFQGSERKIIIYSTVRTDGRLGFIGDSLRLNTAITRAKSLFIMIGNKKSLMKHPMHKAFIEYCAANNAVAGDQDDEETDDSDSSDDLGFEKLHISKK